MIRIEYTPLAEVQRWPRNPKLHAEAAIDESFDRFGFVEPLVLDENTGRLVAGHGRLDRLVALHAAGKPAPGRIKVKRKAWLVPVVRGVSFSSEEEAEAYLLASNQITIAGGWGADVLGALKRVRATARGFSGIGFKPADIDALKARLAPSLGPGGAPGGDDEEAVDPTDEILAKWSALGCVDGSLWEIPSADGSRVHRVLCGDSRIPENVARLMQGKRATLGQHDPPYGIKIVNKGVGVGGGTAPPSRMMPGVRRGNFRPIAGDEEAPSVAHLFENCERVVLWGANNFPAELPPSNTWVVWDKKATADGGAVPENKFSDAELAFVSPRSGETGHARIIRHLWSGITRASELGEKRLAPTQKPIAVIAKPIEWWTEPGDLVTDWYCGSGTTGIAAERLGRVAYLMEITSRYTAVTLERFAREGLSPRRIS